MQLRYLDTETCGLHGPIVLLQYAIDDHEIVLHEVWKEPIGDTLALIEEICQDAVVGFNLAFDWFHICQLYTVLQLLGRKVGFDKSPEDHVAEYAELEPDGRFGPCLKPASASDIMLHARKGPYQSLMDRKDIYIRRVPQVLAKPLISELEKRVKLKDIYFARKKNQKEHWQIQPIKQLDGNYNPDFVNIVLRFAPSSALKTLATDALGLEPDKTMLFAQIEPSTKPIEYGYAPFAKAVKGPGAWPDCIREHIFHWSYYKPAREYAKKDIVYTRDLYKYFGSPESGDDDSILACMVGACRWRGYAIDKEALIKLRAEAVKTSNAAPKAPKKVYAYISEKMSEVERSVLLSKHSGSTKKTVLEEISRWKDHPAGERAKKCIEARQAKKEIEIYDKLLLAGRFHASFKVIGTKSSRMSGTDGLNAQGIKHAKYVRKCFPLADNGLVLCGGDFSSFEVSIADAVYNDPTLRKELLSCSVCKYVCTPDEYRDSIKCPSCGVYLVKCKSCKKTVNCYTGSETCECGNWKPDDPEDARRKIHGLFGQALFPGTEYDDIIATKGSKTEDRYDLGKRGVFSQLYGGNFQTLVNKLAVTEDVAKRAEETFATKYPGIGQARKRIERMFCTMRQEKLGAKISYSEPSDYIETLAGFRRYFTLENQIVKALYTLALKPPPPWKNIKIKLVRSAQRGEQWVFGAAMSAIFSAAFQLQAANMRAAANHEIQSFGSTTTKRLQVKIWDIQPAGVNEWYVQPFNVHDEIMCPTKSELKLPIRRKVDEIIEEVKPLVPLIKIDWSNNMETWADK